MRSLGFWQLGGGKRFHLSNKVSFEFCFSAQCFANENVVSLAMTLKEYFVMTVHLHQNRMKLNPAATSNGILHGKKYENVVATILRSTLISFQCKRGSVYFRKSVCKRIYPKWTKLRHPSENGTVVDDNFCGNVIIQHRSMFCVDEDLPAVR